MKGADRAMACRKRPYAAVTRRVAKSPFRTMAALRRGRKGFTARSSMKAMGLTPRSTGCYVLGPKYR